MKLGGLEPIGPDEERTRRCVRRQITGYLPVSERVLDGHLRDQSRVTQAKHVVGEGVPLRCIVCSGPHRCPANHLD